MAKWGNALGGWRRQPRTKGGQFASKGGSSSINRKAKRRVKKIMNESQRNLSGGSRSRAPASSGTGKRGTAVVPYARTSLRSQSVGVNAGFNLTSNYRISYGGYARLERRQANAAELALKDVNSKATRAVARAISPSRALDDKIEKAVNVGRQKAINKALRGQKNLGGTGYYGRITTSRAGTPSITIRKGAAKVSTEKRAEGISQYDQRMAELRGQRVKPASKRPERRRKERRNKAA